MFFVSRYRWGLGVPDYVAGTAGNNARRRIGQAPPKPKPFKKKIEPHTSTVKKFRVLPCQEKTLGNGCDFSHPKSPIFFGTV